ncbi:hypothetical protein BDN72DRAFT_548608 [Pluteus cervinus]|uniref:Uncharacterized protein n=1 Tax=Pluteus cervinus TaxID=181527 RepID=A0ACD3AX79_9AGAR|nr:hypothetical protein BDN72DRAFT_548608 [Pluteus cervinus]
MRSYAHQVLGLSQSASREEIYEAYRVMSAKWNPDRHPNDQLFARKNLNEVNFALKTLLKELDGAYPHTRPDSSLQSEIDTVSINSFSETDYTLSTSGSDKRFFSHRAYTTESSVTGASSNTSQSSQTLYQRRVASTTAQPSYRYPKESHHGHPPPDKAHPRSEPLSVSPETRYSAPKLDRRQKAAKKVVPREVVNSSYSGQLEDRDTEVPIKGVNQLNYSLPPTSFSKGAARECDYPLSLTLEELAQGKHCRFSILRQSLSGETHNIIVDFDVPPGCREGTKILCSNVGHERRDGTRQDLAFIIKEAPHDRFLRIDDDLFVDVRLPFIEGFRNQCGTVGIEGLNREFVCIRIDYARTRMLNGVCAINGVGMPIRSGGRVVGRGRLVVRWEMTPPKVHPFPLRRLFKWFK